MSHPLTHITPTKSLIEEQQDEIARLTADNNDLGRKVLELADDLGTCRHFLHKADEALEAARKWRGRGFNIVLARGSVKAALHQVAKSALSGGVDSSGKSAG